LPLLRDVAAWAEQGTPPPASTAYELVDGQVIVPTSAKERGGVQPVVRARVQQRKGAPVKVGRMVSFHATIELPDNTGSIVGVEWDFDGSGAFAVKSDLKATNSQQVEVDVRHAVDMPGPYFPAVRGSAQRDGRADSPYARIQNLARVRVVVE
jgi:hypothetical protein